MPGIAPKHEYTRAEVRRMLRVTERQLQSWERRGLLEHGELFSFCDLIAVRTLRELRRARIPPAYIGRALASLKQKLAGIRDPLAELKILSDGQRIAVLVAGQKMEALSGQWLFNFDTAELGAVKTLPDPPSAQREQEAEAWFQKGLDLEERGAPAAECIEAYSKAVELNPRAAGALVNLGTIYFRLRNFKEAERYYRQAIQADPDYPLAQFNLGNLHDEVGDTEQARLHYSQALRLSPQYADAHFNLALLCEKQGDALQAVHHWKAYLKLDPVSSWARIARQQLDKLRQETLISSR